MKAQVFNPYMPSYEYVPDGEPHNFEGRIYVYGSHDRFNGADFCLNDYICYSADEKDLKHWRYEGIIYRKVQDPRNQNLPPHPEYPRQPAIVPADETALNDPGIHAMWAPDVVKGLDGRYYLYYCLDVLPQIGVAVADGPAGPFEFYGFVHYPDGTILGEGPKDKIQFDPGVFIDEGIVYLYSGNAPMTEAAGHPNKGSQVMTLDPDMLTITSGPKHLMPDIYEAVGTEYEDHAFFEASSIRKINGQYYFIYSSVRSHELCYAVSDRPDEGYRFGGTIVDIGDVFRNGRTDERAVNALGNTHGGIECADGKWYVFYHRQTNQTQYSRQGCAERISFDAQGRIHQVEVTSCGLNDGPLEGVGRIPAYIACHVTRNGKNVHSMPGSMKGYYPYFRQDIKDTEPNATTEAFEPVQYLSNIQDNSTIGYKYFAFEGIHNIEVEYRGSSSGTLEFRTEPDGEPFGSLAIEPAGNSWASDGGSLDVPDGVHAFYMTFHGTGKMDLRSFTFEK